MHSFIQAQSMVKFCKTSSSEQRNKNYKIKTKSKEKWPFVKMFVRISLLKSGFQIV